MRDYKSELEKRVKFIQEVVKKADAKGIVYGNSGGKDSTLVGILCKKACENTIGVIMPCSSKQNYSQDREDALLVAKQFNIETREIDLKSIKELFVQKLEAVTSLNANAIANLAPRLRMTVLYSMAASEKCLVAGAGNRSEGYLGYFTKWGDGAYDFNPIADLTVTEIYEFLRYLMAPDRIICKAPSAGLFDGQTDEGELGISYSKVDEYLLKGIADDDTKRQIERLHACSVHKRCMPVNYEDGVV